MMVVDCPTCGHPLAATAQGLLSNEIADPQPNTAYVRVTIDPLSLRRHARCFGGGGGGEPITLLPSAKAFGRALGGAA